MNKEEALRYVQDLKERHIRLGEAFLEEVIPYALESNVPKEFSQAVENYARPNAADPQGVAKELLGIECGNIEEAMYILGMANSFSSIKRLAAEEMSDEQRAELDEKSKEMLGISMDAAKSALEKRVAKLNPFQKKENRFSNLLNIVEENLKDQNRMNRIKVLATTQRI